MATDLAQSRVPSNAPSASWASATPATCASGWHTARSSLRRSRAVWMAALGRRRPTGSHRSSRRTRSPERENQLQGPGALPRNGTGAFRDRAPESRRLAAGGALSGRSRATRVGAGGACRCPVSQSPAAGHRRQAGGIRDNVSRERMRASLSHKPFVARPRGPAGWCPVETCPVADTLPAPQWVCQAIQLDASAWQP